MLPVRLISESPRSRIRSRRGGEILPLHLNVPGHPLRVLIQAGGEPITLADLVPVAREIADLLVRIATKQRRQDGDCISCRKGCTACCRYLVPVSAPEAVCLWNKIRSMPEETRRRLLEPCIHTARTVLSAHQAARGDAPSPPNTTLYQLGRWYAGLELPCPFLDKKVCAIYGLRPIVCQEHIATSPVRYCGGFQPAEGALAPPPLRMSEALAQLSAELQPDWPKAILLPLSLAWANDRTEAQDRAFPPRMLFARLGEILHQQQRQFSAA